MNPTEYTENVLRTESNDFNAIGSRLGTQDVVRLLHAAMGMCTEAGEFMDALKKHVFYGRPIDQVNLMEELGDLLWYIAIAASELGFPLDGIMERNINKLKRRYAEKFSEQEAFKRDLVGERQVLTDPQPPPQPLPPRVAVPIINNIIESAVTAQAQDLHTPTVHRTIAIGGKKEENNG